VNIEAATWAPRLLGGNLARLEATKRTGEGRRGDSGPSNGDRNIVTYRGCKVVTSRLRVY
jgi:hypothetical protein